MMNKKKKKNRKSEFRIRLLIYLMNLVMKELVL
jgi:hypothetical protein